MRDFPFASIDLDGASNAGALRVLKDDGLKWLLVVARATPDEGWGAHGSGQGARAPHARAPAEVACATAAPAFAPWPAQPAAATGAAPSYALGEPVFALWPDDADPAAWHAARVIGVLEVGGAAGGAPCWLVSYDGYEGDSALLTVEQLRPRVPPDGAARSGPGASTSASEGATTRSGDRQCMHCLELYTDLAAATPPMLQVLLLPCRHACVCAGCFPRLLAHAQRSRVPLKCPLCDEPVAAVRTGTYDTAYENI